MPQARSGGSRPTSRSKSTSAAKRTSGAKSTSAAKKSSSSRSQAKRSTASKSSSRAKSTRSSASGSKRSATTAKKSAAGAADARSEAAATRVRKLNERIITAGKEAGESTLTSYETALKAIASAIEKGPGSSEIDWISTLATSQAKFIRDVTTAWTKAARSRLK